MNLNPEKPESTKSPMEEFLGQLRTATAPMHKSLEDNEISRRLMSPEVSLQDYADYLHAMKGVIISFDKRLIPVVSDVISDANIRAKSVDLIADLKCLEEVTNSKNSDAEFTSLDREFSRGFALGYFYVIEGSTLGGGVILKHLASKLVLSPQMTRFFEGYREETGRNWKKFLDEFVAYILEHNLQEEAIGGAIAGFTDIGNHLAKRS